jgi:diamine N-acetyltransferase
METKNKDEFIFHTLAVDDFEGLCGYLLQLSDDTKKRFGPHLYDKESVTSFYTGQQHTGYIAIDAATTAIAAYSIIKTGCLAHDSSRLQSYGLTLSDMTDCTFAPSVADRWQGHGVGTNMLQFILTDVKSKGIKRIILWGGVQADNQKAVSYYKKNGFSQLGVFEYNGLNLDMIAEIM